MGCGSSLEPSVRRSISAPRNSSVSGESTGPDTPTITRQALGRIARLGDLYDATTDEFCGESIFRKHLQSDCPAISRTDNPSINYELIVNSVSCFEEKCRDLHVDGELKLSILAGMCELGGKYINHKMNSSTSAESICRQIYYIKTMTEHLEIRDERIAQYIREENMPNATHVVIQIEWGANCVINVRDENRENKTKNEVQGDLSLNVEDVWSWLKEKAVENAGYVVACIWSIWSWNKPEGEPQAERPAETKERKKEEDKQKSPAENTEKTGKPSKLEVGRKTTHEETDNRKRILVEIVGDVLPDECPQTLEGAQEKMKELPEQVRKSNDGKGKPVAYVMLPLARVSQRKSKRLKKFTSIDEARINRTVCLFDGITKLSQKVNDQIEELKNQDDRDASSELEKAHSLAKALENHKASVQSDFKQRLVNIRSGKQDVGSLDVFCDKHEKTANDYEGIQARIATH